MHYVKQFKINGVDTKQVACIELQGVPNATTEGSLGVLGIDVTSPTHDVYKCVAVNGSIYTWEWQYLHLGIAFLGNEYYECHDYRRGCFDEAVPLHCSAQAEWLHCQGK